MNTLIENSKMREFFSWWSSELADMLPNSRFMSMRRNGSGAVINLNQNQCSLRWENQDRDVSFVDKFTSEKASQEYNKLVAEDKKLLVSSCDVQIAEGMILRRSITLPLTTEENIENVVAYEIDKYTPFKKEDIYFDVKIQKRDKAEKKLTVQLNVIKKSTLEEVLQFSQSCNVSIENIYTVSAANDEVIEELSFVGGLGQDSSSHKQFSANRYLVVLFLLLCLCALTIPIVKNYWKAQQYEAMIAETVGETTEVKELLAVYKAMKQDAKRVSSLGANHSKLVVLLNELTKIIPDDTSLARFSLEENIIRIQGSSSSASKLISIIDSSESFSEVVFVAPVTQNPDTGKEKFAIEIKLSVVGGERVSVQQQ